MAIIINIIFFLFRINPKIPIKNNNNDKFIIFFYFPCGTFSVLLSLCLGNLITSHNCLSLILLDKKGPSPPCAASSKQQAATIYIFYKNIFLRSPSFFCKQQLSIFFIYKKYFSIPSFGLLKKGGPSFATTAKREARSFFK